MAQLNQDPALSEDDQQHSHDNPPELDSVPINSLCLKTKIREAMISDGMQVASDFLNNTVNAYADGGHVMVQMEPGKDRFLAMSVCALDVIDSSNDSLQSLIISPYRTDAEEIMKSLKRINKWLDYKVQVCVAGTIIRADRESIQQGKTQLILGTPGRIIDLIQQKVIHASNVKTLIIDSADKFFGRGIKRNGLIFGMLPKEVQYMFFLENITAATESFIQSPHMTVFSKNAIKAALGGSGIASEKTAKNISLLATSTDDMSKSEVTSQGDLAKKHPRHFFVYAEDNEKKSEELLRLFNWISKHKSVVMCKNQTIVDFLSEKLIEKSLPFLRKLNDKENNTNHLNEFNSVNAGVLLATYDHMRLIRDFSAIIAFNVPNNRDFFSKWLGALRKRHGESGIVISFIDDGDISRLFSQMFRSNGGTRLTDDLAKLL
ncbi:DEAD/DEAH box helicase domain-containing protein [Ditylenchus destructor]|uniref:DEAD/DEAH box helicase domain-containing protein n=1 Tax=Ditylenchus destructor TaxID=166010 RepID=A0AAD4R9E2_9BILA|nr:DEAD/DEAH box helicase domain-containing protein [Ditylenchus destructor]